MSKQEWMVGIIGLLAGIVVTIAFGALYYSSNHNGAGMGDMMRDLKGGNMMDSDSSSADSAEHLSHHDPTDCDGNSCKIN